MESTFTLDTALISSFGQHADIASLSEKYDRVLSNIPINHELIKEFIEKLKEYNSDAEILDTYKINRRFVIITDTFAVAIIHFNCVLMIKNGITESFLQVYEEYFADYEDPARIWVNCFYMQKDELQSQTVPVRKLDFGEIYSDLYPDIDISELVSQYSKSPEKILVLFGQPGTGKTTFIKHILASGVYRSIAYCKDLQAMQSDSFWISMQSGYDLIILDDLDANLSPREGDSNQLVSKMLSFSDGVLVSRSKIIITTNQNIQSIDKAIIRPGRCFDIIELDILTTSEAQDVWTRVLGNPIDTFPKTELQKMSQAALMMAHIRQKDLGRGRTYLRDDRMRNLSVEDKIHKLGIKTSRQTTGFGA